MIIRWLLLIFFALSSHIAIAFPPPQVEALNVTCVACHNNPAIGKYVHEDLLIEKEVFDQGAHANLPCVACHQSLQGPTGFTEVPHQETLINNDCTNCHGGEQQPSFVKKHADAGLPSVLAHISALDCVDCHTSVNSTTDVHLAMPASQVIECRACHTEESNLLTKRFSMPKELDVKVEEVLKGERHNESAKTFFEDKYLPGTVRIAWLDWVFKLAAVGLLALVALHGYGRYRNRKPLNSEEHSEEHLEYLLTLPVRLCHWANAALFLILLTTGIGLHFAFGDMELQVLFHRASGIMLAVSWLAFIVITLSYGGDHYRFKFEGLPDRIKRQADFYLRGIFKGEDHPFHATRNNRFNPLQQLGYIAIMFGLVPGLVVTGLFMLYSEPFPESLMDWVRIGHYLLAGGSLLFMIFHLYLITTGHRPTSLLKSMVDGFHRGRKHK